MSQWHRQVAKHTCKAFIPFIDTLRHLKRRLYPYTTDPAMDKGLLADGLRIIDRLEAAAAPIHGSVVLEIGCGWHPVIPVLFRRAGAARVKMADEARLMDLSLLRSAQELVSKNRSDTASRTQEQTSSACGGTDAMGSFEDALEASELEYLVPFNIADVPDRSVDIIFSRAVLEHIPCTVLADLSVQFRRVLKPNGYMAHLIDNSDHYAHRDPSISFVNFLKFSEWQWKLLTLDPLSYTNRLRHSDYRRLFAQTGFEVVAEEKDVDARSLQALQSLPIAPTFRDFDSEDLATATSLFILKNPAQAERSPF
jgi:SAM-dependent methyltransferase